MIYGIFFFYERITRIVRNLLKFLSVSIATSRYRETIVTTILKFQNIYENERRIAVYGDANYARKGGLDSDDLDHQIRRREKVLSNFVRCVASSPIQPYRALPLSGIYQYRANSRAISFFNRLYRSEYNLTGTVFFLVVIFESRHSDYETILDRSSDNRGSTLTPTVISKCYRIEYL